MANIKQKLDYSKLNLYKAKINQYDIVICAASLVKAKKFALRDFPLQLDQYLKLTENDSNKRKMEINRLMQIPFTLKKCNSNKDLPAQWNEPYIYPWGESLEELECHAFLSLKKQIIKAKKLLKPLLNKSIIDIQVEPFGYDIGTISFILSNNATIDFDMEGAISIYDKSKNLIRIDNV